MLKRIILRPVVCLHVILLLCAVSAGAENLVQNPSFESEKNGMPDKWDTSAYNKESGATEFKYEKGSAHSGNAYAVIINRRENDARFIQPIPVQAGRKYRLSCWVRTENVGSQGKGANISVLGSSETSRDVKGSNGKWESIEMYLHVGKGVDSVVVSAGLGGYYNVSTGMASFDDMRVEEVGDIPKGASVARAGTIENNPDVSVPNKSGAGRGNRILIVIGIISMVVVIGAILIWKFLDLSGNRETGNDRVNIRSRTEARKKNFNKTRVKKDDDDDMM